MIQSMRPVQRAGRELLRLSASVGGTLLVFGLGTLLVTSLLVNTAKTIITLRQVGLQDTTSASPPLNLLTPKR